MNLSFEINKNLLFSSLLFNDRSEAKSLYIEIKNKLWEKYKLPYNHFLKGNDYRNIFVDLNHNLNELVDQTKEMFEEGMQTEEFEELLTETEKYKSWLENEWDSKKDTVIDILKDILRIELPTDRVTVYVVDPKVGGGSYLGNNQIFWGHTEDWNNYNMVYLAHEFLHTFIPSGEIEHCLIELAADNELRIRLNEKSEYFIENNQPLGHDYLREKEKYLLPSWEIYLNNKNKNLYDLIEELKQGTSN
jgi:hypothetical protein